MSVVSRAFAGVAEGYDSWYSTPRGRGVFEAETRLVGRLLPEEGLGVEIGAGTGIFAKSLERPERTIVCIDITPEMLAQARDRGMLCILGSAYALPVRERCLDFVYMVTVAEFLDHLEGALREIWYAIESEGTLIVLFINRDSSWGEEYARIGEAGDPVFSHARLLSVVDVEQALIVAGFDVRESLGTLTSPPSSEDVGGEIVASSPSTGVVAIRALKAGEPIS